MQKVLYIDAVGWSNAYPALAFYAWSFGGSSPTTATSTQGRAHTSTIYATNVWSSGNNVFGIANGSRHMGGANYVFADGHVKWLKGGVPNAGTGGQPAFETDLPILSIYTNGLDYNGDEVLGTGSSMN